MNNVTQKIGSLLAALAILFTTATMNAACNFIMYQDELPEEAKKLRKF
ncbi:MAG TPA: cyclic lactone autoinducer peptide [Ruminococcus sp.]|nr:cyclic lactone autoinducer peptide [Ruminococcus sp.]